MDVMSLADRSWPMLRQLTGVHTHVYRATKGAVGHRFPATYSGYRGYQARTTREIPLVILEPRNPSGSD